VLTQTLTEPARVWDAVAAGDDAGLHAADPELAPWWCPACAAVYCGAHWAGWD